MEATLVLACLASSWRAEIDPGFDPGVHPRVTLRPRRGLPVTLHTRATAEAVRRRRRSVGRRLSCPTASVRVSGAGRSDAQRHGRKGFRSAGRPRMRYLLGMARFPFAFDYPLAAPLALVGITPATAHVDVGDGVLDVRFGLWHLRTATGNISELHVTGPYRWWRVLGTHLSLVDQGVSFGTNTHRGLCITFQDPVPAIAPFGRPRHPGVTVTVADPERLRDELLRASA